MEIKSSNNMADKIFDELRQYNDQFEPKVSYEQFTFYAEENGDFIGGITGFIAWDTLEISNMIALKRGEGIGRKLIDRAEAFAKSKGITKMMAWTLDFQAPEFYKKCGFETFAIVPNSAGKHSCHYLIKRLA